MEGTQFRYVIKFVTDMNKAVKFYRDTLGLQLKFQSPGWSEFVTGETTLALHPASEKNPAGSAELGFSVDDLERFHGEAAGKGIVFTRLPADEHGTKLATFLDCEGAEVSVNGPA